MVPDAHLLDLPMLVGAHRESTNKKQKNLVEGLKAEATPSPSSRRLLIIQESKRSSLPPAMRASSDFNYVTKPVAADRQQTQIQTIVSNDHGRTYAGNSQEVTRAHFLDRQSACRYPIFKNYIRNNAIKSNASIISRELKEA